MNAEEIIAKMKLEKDWKQAIRVRRSVVSARVIWLQPISWGLRNKLLKIEP